MAIANTPSGAPIPISLEQGIGAEVVKPEDAGAIPSKIMTGARAVVFFGDKPVAIFTNVAVSSRQEKVPAFVLGRYSPLEQTPTAQDPISLSLTGWRVFGKGPFKQGVTLVKGLMAEGTFDVKVFDRQNFSSSRPMLTVRQCRIVQWATGFAARSQSDLRLEVSGLVVEDEDSGDNSEGGIAL